MELTNQLKSEGVLDAKTKKNFENIDKGIQQLILHYKNTNQTTQEFVVDAKTKKFFEDIKKDIQKLALNSKKK